MKAREGNQKRRERRGGKIREGKRRGAERREGKGKEGRQAMEGKGGELKGKGKDRTAVVTGREGK